MKLVHKMTAILLVASLVPVLLLGLTGILSIRDIGDRATDVSEQILLESARTHLVDHAGGRALEVERLCSLYESGVTATRDQLVRIHADLGRYNLPRSAGLYAGHDTAGLPAFGFVHPVFGAYADFDGKSPACPWVPRPVLRRVRSDPALRQHVIQSLYSVVLLDVHLEQLERQHRGTMDLAWVVLADGVSNVHPDYDYEEILSRDPGIVDLDETQQDYVRLVAPEKDPDRSVRWLEPYLDPFKGVWMTSCVAPGYDGDVFLGSVGADILLPVITQHIMSLRYGQGGYAFLVTASGRVMAVPQAGIADLAQDELLRRAFRETTLAPAEQHWSDDLIQAVSRQSLSQSPDPAVRQLAAEMVAAKSGVGEVVLSGERKLMAFAPVRGTGWSLAVVVPVHELVEKTSAVHATITEGTQDTLRRYVFQSAVVIAVSVIVGLLLHYLAIRPLSLFTRRIEEVRWDNLTFPEQGRPRHDEIGHLYAKFGEMVRLLRTSRDEMTAKRLETESVNARLLEVNDDLKREIAERGLAEQALSREKELLAVTMRSIGDAVLTTDTDGRVVMLNRMAERLTGWTQAAAAGRMLAEVFQVLGQPAESQDPVAQVLSSNEPVELASETILVARDGTRRFVSDSGAPIRDKQGRVVGVVLVFRDITEKRRLEEELIRAQKLESVRLLAAGIAHDFNNLLTAILGNLSLSRSHKEIGPEASERLADAERATIRARELTQQLLTFSTGGAPVRKSLDLATVVQETAAFALQGSSVSFDSLFATDLWPVLADSGQIGQVVQNLVINAMHAMPRGGAIHITTRNRIVDESTHGLLSPGRYVELCIFDEGSGIAREHLPYIFDPFFTTKPKGSGLGLAVCFSIVKRHGGHIEVESEPGRGTQFRVCLPAAENLPDPAAVPQDALPRGTGRILVMDDDELIRELAGHMISALGYDVDTVADGAAAVDACERKAAEGRGYDAVVLDLTVRGGLGGCDVVGTLTERHPGLRAIVSSGYSTDPVLAEFEKFGFCAAIPKPYDLRAVAETLARVLSSRRG